MVVIFNLGLGQRSFFNHRPHDRFGAHIERTVHQEFAKFTRDGGFCFEVHGDIGMIPVAHNAKAFKFFALNIKPFLGKLAAFLTEFGDWHIVLVFAFGAIAFFDFPFNRKTVAIPTRHIDGILTEHLLRTGDDVF